MLRGYYNAKSIILTLGDTMMFFMWILGFITATLVYAGVLTTGLWRILSWALVAILVVFMWIILFTKNKRKDRRYKYQFK